MPGKDLLDNQATSPAPEVCDSTSDRKWLWRSLNVVSVLVFFGGAVTFLFLLPTISKKTYFSENAMMPGGAASKFNMEYAALAMELRQEINHSIVDSPSKVLQLVKGYGQDLGLEVSEHHFEYMRGEERLQGLNLVVLMRAHRTEGKEVVVLSSEYPDTESSTDKSATVGSVAVSLAFLMSVMRYASNSPWLSKDIIFLVTPMSVENHQALDQWLLDYHRDPLVSETTMFRGGEIWAAVCVKLPETGFDSMAIAFEGDNGEFPNLDLVNVAVFISKRMGMNVILPVTDVASGMTAGIWEYLPGWLRSSCRIVHAIIVNQALGKATGNHGAFKSFRVEAITLVGHNYKGYPRAISTDDIRRYGQVFDGVVRVISNILERFHQSFFFWLLTEDNRYVPIEEYLLPCAAMLLPLILRAVVVFHSATMGTAWPFFEYLLIATSFFVSCILLGTSSSMPPSTWAVMLSTLLAVAPQILMWSARADQDIQWHVVKAQILVLSTLGMVVLAMVNFSFAAVSAMVVVPAVVLTVAQNVWVLKIIAGVAVGFSIIWTGPQMLELDESQGRMQGLVLILFVLLPPFFGFTCELLSFLHPVK